MSNSKFTFNLSTGKDIHAPYIEANMTEPIKVTQSEFIFTLFGDAKTRGVSRNSKFGDRWPRDLLTKDSKPYPVSMDNYYSVGAFEGEGSGKNDSKRMMVVVADDYPLERLSVEPTYILQTSESKPKPDGSVGASYQVGFAITDGDNLKTADRLMQALYLQGHADKSGNNRVRLARLPQSTNNKHDKPFKTRVTRWNPEKRFGLMDVARALGVDLSSKPEPVEGVEDSTSERLDLGACIDSILDGLELHENINRVAMSYVGQGMPRNSVIVNLQTLMLRVEVKDSRWQERYDDIERSVDSAIKKKSDDQEAERQPKPPVITYTFGSGIITEDIPPHPFLIPNWLPLEAATLMSGNGGLGKSYIALEIGIGIACGGVVLGSRVEPSRVVYISAEDPLNTIKWRARQFLRSPAGQELDHSKLSNLKAIDWSVEKEKILYKLNSGSKNSAGFDVLTMERLREIVIEHDPVLVIVDNDSSLFGGSEIDRSQVNEYMMGMLEMQRLAAWLLLHHIDKSSARAGKDDAYSGSTAWNNSARARWSLGTEMLTVQKNNYGPKGYQAVVHFDDAHKCFVIGEPQPPSSNNFSRQREIEKAVIIALGSAPDLRLRLSVKADQKKPVRTVLSELRGVSADQSDVQAAVNKLSQPPFNFLVVVDDRCRVTDNRAKFVVLTAEGVENFNRLMSEGSDD